MISILGDKRSSNDRFAPLEITSKIHRKISKFGTQAPIVEKALSSFEHFYKAANKLDDDLIHKHGPKLAAQVMRCSSFICLASSSPSILGRCHRPIRWNSSVEWKSHRSGSDAFGCSSTRRFQHRSRSWTDRQDDAEHRTGLDLRHSGPEERRRRS